MNPAPKIYIVRIIDKDSNPMVGVVRPNGKPGSMCYEYKNRTFYPHDQILIDPDGNKIIQLDYQAY